VLDLGCVILKTEGDNTELVEHKDFQTTKSLQVEAVLEPGTYVVLPRSTGCLIPEGLPQFEFSQPQADLLTVLD